MKGQKICLRLFSQLIISLCFILLKVKQQNTAYFHVFFFYFLLLETFFFCPLFLALFTGQQYTKTDISQALGERMKQISQASFFFLSFSWYLKKNIHVSSLFYVSMSGSCLVISSFFFLGKRGNSKKIISCVTLTINGYSVWSYFSSF